MMVASAHCMLPLRMGDSSFGSTPGKNEIKIAALICRKAGWLLEVCEDDASGQATNQCSNAAGGRSMILARCLQQQTKGQKKQKLKTQHRRANSARQTHRAKGEENW